VLYGHRMYLFPDTHRMVEGICIGVHGCVRIGMGVGRW
jgi:hypothetical protein